MHSGLTKTECYKKRLLRVKQRLAPYTVDMEEPGEDKLTRAVEIFSKYDVEVKIEG